MVAAGPLRLVSPLTPRSWRGDGRGSHGAVAAAWRVAGVAPFMLRRRCVPPAGACGRKDGGGGVLTPLLLPLALTLAGGGMSSPDPGPSGLVSALPRRICALWWRGWLGRWGVARALGGAPLLLRVAGLRSRGAAPGDQVGCGSGLGLASLLLDGGPCLAAVAVCGALVCVGCSRGWGLALELGEVGVSGLTPRPTSAGADDGDALLRRGLPWKHRC